MLLVLHIFSSELPGSPDSLCSLLYPAVYLGRLTMMCLPCSLALGWIEPMGSTVGDPWGCHAWAGCLLGARGHSSCQAVLTLQRAGSLGSFIFYFLPIRPGDSCDMSGNELLLLSSWYRTILASPRLFLYTLLKHLQLFVEGFYLAPFKLPICSLPGP